MRYLLFIFVLLSFSACSDSQRHSNNPVSDLEQTLAELSAIDDSLLLAEKTDQLWDSLSTHSIIPTTHDSTVIFLFRGEAESVSWNGDFNSWSGDKRFQNSGTNVPGTDLWFLKATLPADGRYDYKVTINDEQWILDPANPYQQWSGFGPNSELRMPEWKPEPLKVRLEEAPKGNFSGDQMIHSDILGYDISYRVYLPSWYSKDHSYPVAYFTDGQEYSHDSLGASIIMLDNLIHLKKIEPVIGVFVSPLNPDDESENRRAEEFAMNENYLNFYTQELIPGIESTYSVSENAEDRAIIGTSFGGLAATYFAFSRPDIFGNTCIQAPAYWYREDIYDLVRNSSATDLNIFMSVGTAGDNTVEARLMRDIFMKKGLDFTYKEVNEGHSWGAWSTQMDEVFIQFFGN